VQAKTSSAFDSGDLSKFFQAALDFFKEKASFQQNEHILELQRIKNRLYDSAAKFVRGLPKIALYYATTGTWTDDKNLCAIRDGFLAQASALHMFAGTSFHPLDATRVQKLYFQTKKAFRVSISFGQNLSFPEIPNVRESYIGLLPISEYLKLITDDDGNVRRRLFFDNIRDFQGNTPATSQSAWNCCMSWFPSLPSSPCCGIRILVVRSATCEIPSGTESEIDAAFGDDPPSGRWRAVRQREYVLQEPQ
jgi:hypothetical protein